MSKWDNETGKTLSSIEWLKIHHNAKLNERVKFMNSIIDNKIKSIIDLGCGPGLWLEILNNIVTSDCKLIGVDTDQDTLDIAKYTAEKWNRQIIFINCDIENEIDKLPKVDLILAFNIFPYLNEPDDFLEKLRHKLNPNGKIIIRQYDGGTMRFGPMDEPLRHLIDESLYSSIGASNNFHHYDLDRVTRIINSSKFTSKKTSFELFQKTSPYSSEFQKYIEETIQWTFLHISDYANEKLTSWYNTQFVENSYFFEVDLVSILS